MGILGWAIVLIVASIVCRVLRAAFKVVDWIVYLFVLGAFIYVWINDGFWMGLITGIIGCIVVSLLFGIGSGTEVRKFGHKYTLSCNNCGYDDLEITSHTELGVVTRCRRCGEICHHTLNH